jgi:hypothetical protein
MPNIGETVSAITHPISLCAYVIAAVFGVLAKHWDSSSDRPRDRQLFYLAVTLSVVALGGGLFLGWKQIPSKSIGSVSVPITQTSFGDQSPNINSSGSGSVSVQNGPAPAQTPVKPQEKKK